MRTSEKGIHLMHLFEGLKDRPYLCPASIWTVGFGVVLYQEQIRLPIVRKEGYAGLIRSEYPLRQEHNRVWSRAELDNQFKDLLVSFERGVLRLAPVLDGNQAKFDACVCLSYNIGLGNFQRSGLRQKILRGDWENAAEAFLDWSKAGGKVLKGLLRRREAERALFLSE